MEKLPGEKKDYNYFWTESGWEEGMIRKAAELELQEAMDKVSKKIEWEKVRSNYTEFLDEE